MDPDELAWTSPAFRHEAIGWIERQLANLGLQANGEIEQPHVAWWSTVLRVPTSAGTLWFKATGHDGAHEARLTPLLARLHPGEIVEVVATDDARGWLLERDAGTRLRELGDGAPQVEHWERLLPRYAELQIAAAAHVNEVLGMGVPDRRLAVLPDELAALLDEPEHLMLGAPGGISAEQRTRLRQTLPAFVTRCERLAAVGLPQTIQHDDLNDGNVFVRDGRYLTLDWGDACVSHPFHTLVVVLRAAAYKQGWAPGGAEVRRLLGAYLEPWQRFAPDAELRAAADLARRTGTVQRALAWRSSVAAMPPQARAEYVESIPYGLRVYLQDGPWGTWDDGSF
jgi:hypothetical protein